MAQSRFTSGTGRDVEELDIFGFENLDEDQIRDLKKLAKKNFSEFISYSKNLNEKRDSAPIRIAVTGTTGSGKSTFVNTIRGLEQCDRGAAPVGITETTKTATAYKHPEYDNIVFVDLPGVGTCSYPSDTYFTVMQITSYDIIVVFYDSRFTEKEQKIAKRLVEKGRGFVFVRSKFDLDVANERKRSRTVTQDQVKQKLRTEIKSKFYAVSRSLLNIPVFFINGDCRTEYEFPLLEEHLLELMSKEKKRSLLRSLQSTSWLLLEEKKNYLLKRINVMAGAAAVGSLQPIPGVDLLINIAVIAGEVFHYKKTFDFTEKKLQLLSSETNLEYARLKRITEKHVKNMTDLTFDDVKELIKIITPRLGFAAAAITAGSLLDLVLPFIGVVITAPASFVFVRKMLREILLGKFYPCAKEIQTLVDEASKNKLKYG